MSEQKELVGRLDAALVLAGISWAYRAATARTLADYSEDAGHDASWLGQTRHALFRDRLDRAFSCGRYALLAGLDDVAGLDLVRAELTEREASSMPRIPAGVVSRADLDLSPGWAFEDVRFLLASAPFGKVASMPWAQKSPTKQRVAQQPGHEPPPTLFDEQPPGDIEGLLVLGDCSLDRATFVVAHSLDPVTQRRELVLGHPRMNHGGGPAWYWYENLLAPPQLPGARQLDHPAPLPPDAGVPDADVRLRRKAEARNEPAQVGAG